MTSLKVVRTREQHRALMIFLALYLANAIKSNGPIIKPEPLSYFELTFYVSYKQLSAAILHDYLSCSRVSPILWEAVNTELYN